MTINVTSLTKSVSVSTVVWTAAKVAADPDVTKALVHFVRSLGNTVTAGSELVGEVKDSWSRNL